MPDIYKDTCADHTEFLIGRLLAGELSPFSDELRHFRLESGGLSTMLAYFWKKRPDVFDKYQQSRAALQFHGAAYADEWRQHRYGFTEGYQSDLVVETKKVFTYAFWVDGGAPTPIVKEFVARYPAKLATFFYTCTRGPYKFSGYFKWKNQVLVQSEETSAYEKRD